MHWQKRARKREQRESVRGKGIGPIPLPWRVLMAEPTSSFPFVAGPCTHTHIHTHIPLLLSLAHDLSPSSVSFSPSSLVLKVSQCFNICRICLLIGLDLPPPLKSCGTTSLQEKSVFRAKWLKGGACQRNYLYFWCLRRRPQNHKSSALWQPVSLDAFLLTLSPRIMHSNAVDLFALCPSPYMEP